MQNLSIQGLINARDLGGLVTTDGKQVRKRKLIRADALNNLTSAGIEKLRDYGLNTIIDLRTETERDEKPDPGIQDVAMLQIPIFEEETAGITREKDSTAKMSSVPDMSRLYRHMVSDDHSVAQLAKVVTAIMKVNTGCVLFHCTAGKDRTGVVAMLLLGILGVSDEDILEDYIYTNATGADVAYAYSNMVLKKTGNEALAESVKRAFLADESYLLGAMSVIEGCGGYDQFFRKQLGVADEEIDHFRKRMLQ